MIRSLLLFLALLASPAAAAQLEPVQVKVARSGDGFVADFTFPRPAEAWGFFRSSVAASDRRPWRPRSWTVLTPGVSLTRRGNHDALIAARGGPVPRKVRVRVTPFTEHLVADYVPTLRLGGNSIALFDGHFAVFSLDRAAALDTLPAHPDGSLVGDGGTWVRFVGRRLRIAGDVEGYRTGSSEGAYGLFDVPRAIVRNGVATVIDGELPQWLADDLAGYTPRVIATLTSRLGPAEVAEPTILAAWEGPGRAGASMNGGALKGLILMRFEGQAALTRNPALAQRAHWFIAHEAAHFWIGQAVRHAGPRDGWISEGGADLLAYRTVAATDPAYDVRAALQEALDQCIAFSRKGGIATAGERGDHQAFYHCGAIFSLVAERVSGGDFAAFVRGLIESNQSDKQVTAAEWLAALEARAPGKHLAERIRNLLDRPAPDAQPWIDLLARSGIPHMVDENLVPRLQ